MIRLPAYFTGFSSKSDGSAGLRFATQELSADDFAELKKHHNAFGWLIFSENKDEVIPDENAQEDELSASEVLRRRMFVYHKQKGIEIDFNTWRRQQLAVLGERYIEKLN